jgi:drug/metabolite transporter (DMT)-like permease
MTPSTPRAGEHEISWKFLILLVSVPLTAAGNLIAGRYALNSFTPPQANALRYLLALLILLPILHRWPRPRRSEIPALSVTGVLGVCIYNILFFSALELIPAAEAGLLEMIIPAASLALAWLLLRERINMRQVTGIVVGWFGVVWLVKILPPGAIAGKTSGDWRGEILMIVAVLIFAVYSITGKSAMTRLPPPAVATWSCLFGTIPLVLLAVPEFAADPHRLLHATLASWLGVVYGGAVGFVYNIIAWYYCFRRIGVARTNIFLYLVPIFGAALAVPIFHESLTGWQVFGSSITLFGVVLATMQFRRGEAAVPPAGQGAGAAEAGAQAAQGQPGQAAGTQAAGTQAAGTHPAGAPAAGARAARPAPEMSEETSQDAIGS